MKKRLLPLLLILCFALSFPVSAFTAEDFKQGALSGITAADDGALLVTDTFNKVVWRVEGDKVTQYAGAISVADLSGEPTAVYHDAVADKAYFMEPWDVVPFLDGYAVSDSAANVVRYVANGRVYTLAGSGKAGRTDGAEKAAAFDRPTGLAVDAEGLLYVADTGSGAIRRIARDGKVTTVATGLLAPTGLCWSGGALYVAETGRSRIVRIASGRVEAFAGVSAAAEDGGEYYGGYVDGPAAAAQFDHPQGIVAGADGTLYVADTGNSAVRAIRDGRVCTLARGSSTALMPTSPRGLLVQGSTLYVTDQFAGSFLTLSIAQRTYTDVEAGAWYGGVVNASGQRGIAYGTSQTRFEPNTTMNRAMFVTMLSRVHRSADGNAIIDGDASFPDVPENEWYAAAVRWAADSGVTTGSDGRFEPTRSISREEIATMLYRYAKTQGLSVSKADEAAFRAFGDASAASSWAEEALAWAVGTGVLSGNDLRQLNPGAPATRAEALTMLIHFMDAYSL